MSYKGGFTVLDLSKHSIEYKDGGVSDYQSFQFQDDEISNKLKHNGNSKDILLTGIEWEVDSQEVHKNEFVKLHNLLCRVNNGSIYSRYNITFTSLANEYIVDVALEFDYSKDTNIVELFIESIYRVKEVDN